MIDTPYETWCARVAHQINHLHMFDERLRRQPDENAVEYLERVYGVSQVWHAFQFDLTPERFFAWAVPV